MRRLATARAVGWWKTGVFSVGASASLHMLAGLAVAVVGWLQAHPEGAKPPEWGIVEVTSARTVPPSEVLSRPLERPAVSRQPIPIPPPRLTWKEPAPLPSMEPPEAAHPPEAPPPETTPPVSREPIREEPPPAPAGASTTAPSAMDNPSPDYPDLARRRGYEGVVILLARISPEGEPMEVTVQKSSGHRVLDRAARRAVLKWKFRPAIRAGEPVAGEVEIPIRFRLDYR